MPTGLRRYSGHDYLHFLTCSCYHRQPWLASPRRRDLFLQIFEEVRQRYQFVVVGYVVMPNHIHLLVGEPELGTPSTVMQVMKQRFARRILNRKRRNPGQAALWPGPPQHVWQKRFYDFHVWSERKRVEKLRYMHRNPVKEGLVQEPELWVWSSYRSYAYGEPGMVKTNLWPNAEVRQRPAA
jgi:putative transposase